MRATAWGSRTETESADGVPEAATWDMLSVLVVEDEPGICDVFHEALGRHRCRVTACTRGEQAVEEARSHSFDIVFIDVMMPGMNGLQVMHALHRAVPKAVFIMITGYPDSELVERCLSEAALLSLCKPLGAAEIADLVRDLAGRR